MPCWNIEKWVKQALIDVLLYGKRRNVVKMGFDGVWVRFNAVQFDPSGGKVALLFGDKPVAWVDVPRKLAKGESLTVNLGPRTKARIGVDLH